MIIQKDGTITLNSDEIKLLKKEAKRLKIKYFDFMRYLNMSFNSINKQEFYYVFYKLLSYLDINKDNKKEKVIFE